MKKVIIILIVAVLAFGAMLSLSACNTPDEILLVVPDGAPALAIAKLLNENAQFDGYKIRYEIVSGAEQVKTKFASKEATLAIMPTNLASIFYNNSEAKMLSVNTHGVLYLVGMEDAASLDDLVGNVVYNIGRGSVPDLTFKYILKEKEIDFEESDTPIEGKIALKYVTSGTEIIQFLKSGAAKFGIMGEPAVSQSVAVASTKVLFDISELWEEVTENGFGYPQAVFVAQSDFINNGNDELLSWLLEKMEESSEWILENPEQAGQALKDNGSTLAVTFTKSTIENCNIWVGRAIDERISVETFLTAMLSFEPASIGGALPGADFYYEVRKA